MPHAHGKYSSWTFRSRSVMTYKPLNSVLREKSLLDHRYRDYAGCVFG